MSTFEYIPPPAHPDWLEGNEVYAQLFMISMMIIFLEFLERGRSILLTVYLVLVSFPLVVVWWYLDTSGAMIGVCFWEWFQKRNHGGAPSCCCDPVSSAVPTVPQEPVAPISSALVPVVLPDVHAVSPSVPIPLPSEPQVPVVPSALPSEPQLPVVPVSSSLCSAGVDAASGDYVTSGGNVADVSGVSAVSCASCASGIASSDVRVTSGDEVSPGVVVASACVGVSAGVSEDNQHVDVDGLCAAFFKLTIEDPYDEDVFMRLLDRRDFGAEEYVDSMELVEDMDYEEGPSLMSVVCSPVVDCVSAAPLITTPSQEDPFISNPLAIPSTSPTDSVNFIPVSLPPLTTHSASSPAMPSTLSPPVITAITDSITATPSPIVTATSTLPVITATPSSPIINPTSPSPIPSVISPSHLATTSPIITATPLAVPFFDIPEFSAMPPMLPDTAAFVTPADILNDMNTILTSTPTTTINEDPFMATIDPMLLTIMDDIPFTTMLMTDILLPLQPHQEQQQLPSSPPQSPLPPATVVDDFDPLFEQFIEIPDE